MTNYLYTKRGFYLIERLIEIAIIRARAHIRDGYTPDGKLLLKISEPVNDYRIIQLDVISDESIVEIMELHGWEVVADDVYPLPVDAAESLTEQLWDHALDQA